MNFIGNERVFASHQKALGQLERFIAKEKLSDLEKLGLMKTFEYTFELAWNTSNVFENSFTKLLMQSTRLFSTTLLNSLD